MSSAENAATDTDLAHAMSTLTPEERAAMTDELSDDEKASLKAVADAKVDDEADDDSDAAGDGEGTAAAAPAAAPATAPTAAPATAPAPAAEAAAPAEAPAQAPAAAPAAIAPAPLPTYDAKLPENYQSRVDKLATDSEALEARLESGEITAKEFNAERRKLEAERDDLTSLRTKAEIADEFNQQQGRNAWNNAVSAFLSQKPDGVDYREDKARGADLDSFVKALANNPANENQPMEWFLREAHRRVQALHGAVASAPAAAATPTAAAPAAATPAPSAAKPPSRKPDLSTLPQTLAGVPGADGPGDVGDEFADLDALDGPKLEAALARLSPEKRERYLAGS